jgi:hypothetical protein
MKKIILSTVVLLTALFSATDINAQGLRIHPKGGSTGTTGWVTVVPNEKLNFVEGYDVTDPKVPTLEGTWKIKELKSTAEYMSEANWGLITFGENFPAFNAEDKVTFEAGKLIPGFQSALKNYFKGEATYTDAGEYDIHYASMMGNPETLKIIKVKGVNRNFDATNISEDDEAYIGYRMVEDEDADEAGVYFMEVYLIDYKATSFAPEFIEYMYYGDEKPVAAMSGMAIMFTMTKQ